MAKTNSQAIPEIRSALLNWYHKNKRDLPWRGESDIYRIWVSEVMLQQTQVVTVIPYYHRFLEQFPTVTALANAPLVDVLKVWEGLGYYARARNLHKASKEIVEKWNGQFPTNYADLLTLPGFGSYTAGAVASIASGEVVPAVDGNAKRVLARLFAIKSDITRGAGARQTKELAAELVPTSTPGDWNQAVMELGATICLPKSPKCSMCPVQHLCVGRARGVELELPVKPARKPLPHFNVTAAVIRKNGKVLIAQRPPNGMLGGMWEFPGGKQEPGESLPDCLRREIKEELGVNIKVGQPIVSVKHSYTHFKITLHAFYCDLPDGSPQAIGVADWRWVTMGQLDQFPFPRTDLQIIEALRS